MNISIKGMVQSIRGAEFASNFERYTGHQDSQIAFPEWDNLASWWEDNSVKFWNSD